MQLSLAELELELIDILRGQGLPATEIRLIGLIGKGTRASVFSVMIDGVYHVLKVYDSKESLGAELKNLRKMTPKDRFLFSWREPVEEGPKLNIAIIEVPEGQELNSEFLTQSTADRLADRLTELYRLRYRQRVSVTTLSDLLRRQKAPFLEMIKLLGLDEAGFLQLYEELKTMLKDRPDTFRVPKRRIHGDLWWPNIIVAQEDVYLIDWESLHRGDPAEDLAKLRLVVYWPRNEAVPTYFWQDPTHGPRLAELIKTIVARYNETTGEDIVNRLRFYMPFLCVYELAQRYQSGHTTQLAMVKNRLLAEEALRLIVDPLSPPPDLGDFFSQVIPAGAI